MDLEDVCLSGTGCITSQGNRNLADFFAITMDNTGAAEIVYDDMSNGLIQPPFAASNPADHAGAAQVTVIRQNAGTGLLRHPGHRAQRLHPPTTRRMRPVTPSTR